MDRPLETKRWTRRKVVLLSFVLLVCTTGLYSLFAELSTSKLRVDRDRLRTATVERAPFQEFIVVTGNVVPLRVVFLETIEGGRIEEVAVEEGSIVEAGEPLVRLTNTDLHLEVMRREDQLLEQRNQLVNTQQLMEQEESAFERRLAELEFEILKKKRVFERDRSLYEEKLIPALQFELSRDELDFLNESKRRTIERETQETRFREARIRQMFEAVARMERNSELAQEKLDNLVIRSPIEGQLSSLDAEVGQTKAAGEQIGQVDGTDGFKIRAEVDQHFISRIQTGQTAEMTLGDDRFEAEVFRIYPEVTDGRFEIDLRFLGSPPQGIRRGQILHLRLALGDASEELVLPRGPFFQQTGGRWAFVVDRSGGTAVRRSIRLGRQNPDYFEVLDGLEAGDRVIVSSYEHLAEFDELSLQETTR